MDKAGNFIGWLHIEGVNLSVALVEHALSKVHFTAERSPYSKALLAAEEAAKQRKEKVSDPPFVPPPRPQNPSPGTHLGGGGLGAHPSAITVPSCPQVWSHYEETPVEEVVPVLEEKERTANYKPVFVTEITDDLHFYVQDVETGEGWRGGTGGGVAVGLGSLLRAPSLCGDPLLAPTCS